MAKILHDPIGDALSKKFPLQLRCPKCKRTLEFEINELRIHAAEKGKVERTVRCDCVCGKELMTADRDIIMVVENFTTNNWIEATNVHADTPKTFTSEELIITLSEMGMDLSDIACSWCDLFNLEMTHFEEVCDRVFEKKFGKIMHFEEITSRYFIMDKGE